MRPSLRVLTLAITVSLLTVVAPPGSASAATMVRSPGKPSYVVNLSAGPAGHVWSGTERIAFRNLRQPDLTDIWLRLWSNGVLGCGAHSIEISKVIGGVADTPTVNCTAVHVTLDSPVAHGATASLKMHVRIEVPNRNDRFGYHGALALMGTALPTLAIHDDQGWHLDPFIDLGESFYSIVGHYRVTLATRPGLVTPTTGLQVGSGTLPDGREVRTYVAKNVRDFEWAAGKLKQLSTDVGGTKVVVSYAPSSVSAELAARSLDVSRTSMRSFNRAFGAFPYPEMDVVLTAFASFGGMEYPTIIFTNPPPTTIAHEVAHQWWYGIVGDDQFSEPWLDESFATWSEFLPFGGWHRCRRFRFPGPGARITNDMAYWFDHPDQYGTIYSGGGCMLANLAHRFGFHRFLGILHGYARRHWQGVARTADFKRAIAHAAATALPGFDVNAFWTTWRVD